MESRFCATLIAAALIVGAASAEAQTRFSVAGAPPGLKTLIEANRDKPDREDGCLLLDELKADDEVAVLHPLDAGHGLLVMQCMRTMKFNVQRVFIVVGGDYAAATRAELPVRRAVDPSGVTSDSMALSFDPAKKLLVSEAWEGASCWSKRLWKWTAERFVSVGDRRSGGCG